MSVKGWPRTIGAELNEQTPAGSTNFDLDDVDANPVLGNDCPLISVKEDGSELARCGDASFSLVSTGFAALKMICTTHFYSPFPLDKNNVVLALLGKRIGSAHDSRPKGQEE
jgi:hypothetical protein